MRLKQIPKPLAAVRTSTRYGALGEISGMSFDWVGEPFWLVAVTDAYEADGLVKLWPWEMQKVGTYKGKWSGAVIYQRVIGVPPARLSGNSGNAEGA